MREIARVKQERWSVGQGSDPCDGVAQRRGDVGIRSLVEADVTVADLHETEVRRGFRRRVAPVIERDGLENAARHGPYGARAYPCHAVQESAPVPSMFVVCHSI